MAQYAHGGPESRGPAPKLGRDGRREIGRALGAMYDDVVREGVPPQIVELLDGLDRRAQGGLDPSPA
jgi:Anti-sigma factor NepR